MKLKTGAQFVLTSFFYSGADVAARCVQFFCLFALARSCTKEQYGAVGLIFATQQLFTMLALAGLTEAMTGRTAEFRKRDGLGSLFAKTHRLLVKKITALLFFAVLVASVVQFFGAEHVSPLAVFSACMSGMLLARSRLIGVMYQLEERHLIAVHFKTIPILVCYSVGLGCACAWSNPVDGLFLGGGGGLLLWTLVTSRVPFPSPATSSHDARLERSLFTDSLHFSAIAFLGWLSGYGNSVVVRGMFDARAVADYTMVCHFGGIMVILLTSITTVWSPRFYKMASEHTAERVNVANSLVFLCQSLVVAVAGGLILILYPLIPRLLQGNFTEYSHLGLYIAMVYAAYIVLTGYYRTHAYYLLYRKGPEFFRILLVTSVIGFAAWFAAMVVTGTLGVYLGVVILAAFRSAGTYFYARTQWGLSSCWPDLIAALAILGSAYAMTVTPLSIWLQLLGFSVFAAGGLISLYFGSMAKKFRDLRRHRSICMSAPAPRCESHGAVKTPRSRDLPALVKTGAS